MEQDVEVEFKYKCRDGGWLGFPTTARDFFDTRYEYDGGRIDMHFPAIHLDYRNFLPVEKSSIVELRLEVQDPIEGFSRSEYFQYWNRGKCVLIHRVYNMPGYGPNHYVLQVKVDESKTLVTTHFTMQDGELSVYEFSVDVDEQYIDTQSD